MLNCQVRTVAFGDICSSVKKRVSSADGTIPCVELENIESGNPKLNGFTTTDLIKSQKTAFQVGDVLFGKCRPYLRKTWFATFSGACSTEIWALRANAELIDPKYLHAIVQSERFNEHANLTSGTKMPRADWSHVSKFEVKLPPIEKQREIAACFSTWDRSIELHDKLIALKEKQKQGLMQVLLTGKKRLLDDNGVPFSGEWGSEKLSSLCTIKTGKKDVNEGSENGAYPFFTCANEPTRSNSFSYDCEALLIAGNGSVGRTHYYNGKFEAYQRTYILSNFKDIVDTKFLHQYILFWLGFEVEKGKQHGAMPYIKIGLLQTFDVLIPEVIEQQKIASALLSADNEVNALKRKRDLLNQQKQGLMQQLLG